MTQSFLGLIKEQLLGKESEMPHFVTISDGHVVFDVNAVRAAVMRDVTSSIFNKDHPACLLAVGYFRQTARFAKAAGYSSILVTGYEHEVDYAQITNQRAARAAHGADSFLYGNLGDLICGGKYCDNKLSIRVGSGQEANAIAKLKAHRQVTDEKIEGFKAAMARGTKPAEKVEVNIADDKPAVTMPMGR